MEQSTRRRQGRAVTALFPSPPKNIAVSQPQTITIFTLNLTFVKCPCSVFNAKCHYNLYFFNNNNNNPPQTPPPVVFDAIYNCHWPSIHYCFNFNYYFIIWIIYCYILNNLISVQLSRSTRSSSVVTLSRPPTISSLKITDCSFRYASSCVLNQLPDSLRQSCQSRLDSPPHSLVSSSLLSSPLSSSITPSL